MTLEDLATVLLGEMDKAINDPVFRADVERAELHPGNPVLQHKVMMTRQYVAGLSHAYDLVEEAIREQ